MALVPLEPDTNVTAGHRREKLDIGDRSFILQAERFSPVTTVVPEFVTFVVCRRALSLKTGLRHSK